MQYDRFAAGLPAVPQGESRCRSPNVMPLVTGSTSGIGLAIARALAKEGADVVLNGFHHDEATIEANRGLDRAGVWGQGLFTTAPTWPKAPRSMIWSPDAQNKMGSVDILVNNAGIQHVSPIEDFPPEKWDAIIAINLTAPFRAIRAAIPGMKAQKMGTHHQHRLSALARRVAVQGRPMWRPSTASSD